MSKGIQQIHLPFIALFCFSVILSQPSVAKADGDPDFPHNPNMVDASSDVFNLLTGSCTRKSKNTITCDFVQTMVRTETDPEDISTKVEEAVDGFKSAVEKDGQDAYRQVSNKLDICTEERGKEFKTILEEKASNQHEKDISQKAYDSIKKLCDVKDEESYRAAVTALLEVEAVTCKVWNNHFTLEFNYDYSSQIWLSKTGPLSSCGIIEIISLYKSPEFKETKLFWTYEQQRVVTNKNGQGLLGSCKDRDVEPSKYETSSEPQFMHCEYIRYGM